MKQDHQDGPTLHNPEKLNEVDDDVLLPHSSKLASPKVRPAQRVEEGRPSYLDITRQNVKILQSRQTWSGFFCRPVKRPWRQFYLRLPSSEWNSCIAF